MSSEFHAMSAPRSGSSISPEDRMSLLQALRIEGYERVMRDKEKVLNKYFTATKTRKEVDKILRYYTLKSKDYNPYQFLGFRDEDNWASHALSKWHHVLPEQEATVAAALPAALEVIAMPHNGFSTTERGVLSFLSTLMETGGGHEMLDLPAVLLVSRLMQDLAEDVNESRDTSRPHFVHISQSFWKLLHEKECGKRATDRTIETNPTATTTIDSQAASLDPYQLSVRLKLIERIDEIVAESIRLSNELSQSNV